MLGNGLAPFARFLLDEFARFFPRLRSIKQRDTRAHSRSRDEPDQTSSVVLSHDFILTLDALCSELMDELVTVFRSADEDAETDANEIADSLKSQGISATVLNDDAPGVL